MIHIVVFVSLYFGVTGLDVHFFACKSKINRVILIIDLSLKCQISSSISNAPPIQPTRQLLRFIPFIQTRYLVLLFRESEGLIPRSWREVFH